MRPLCLAHLGVGARDEHAPLRVLRAAGPHLLPGHHPFLAVLDRARLQRREIRAGVGLGEALAPDLLARRGSAAGSAPSARRVPHTISVGPPSSSPRMFAAQRHARAADLLEVDRRFGRRGAAPAVLGGPAGRRPARVVQPPLPVAPPGAARVLAALGGLGVGRVIGQPGAQLVAEGRLLGAESQVHERAEAYCSSAPGRCSQRVPRRRARR